MARLWLMILLVLVLLVPFLAQAQTDLSARGFDHFYNLEYDQALADFELAVTADPQAPAPYNSIAQALLYREMFRNGALESELVSGNNAFLRRPKLNPTAEVEKRFEASVQKALELSQTRLDKNANDISALYTSCVANGLRSNYDFLVRKAWKDALSEATTARKLCNRVTELDSSNYDARLVQGVHDYVVGSLPWFYKSLGFLAGFHGDRETGIRTLESVASKGKYNKVDSEILLCALYRRENQTGKAIPLLTDLLKRYPRNYLLRFESAQMYSAMGNRKSALETMELIGNMKSSGAPGYAEVPWEKIWYEKGNLLFWFNDLDQSLENFKKVTANTADLDLSTGVLAFMRMGQAYDMKNRHDLATVQYNKAIAFAPQAEAARESRKYIASPYKRAKT